MNCRRACSLISAYLDAELSGDEMASVREHIEVCQSCQSETEAIVQIKSLVSRSSDPCPSPDFEIRLIERVFGDTPTATKRSFRIAHLLGVAVAAGAIAFALASFLAPSRGSRPVGPSDALMGSEIRHDQMYYSASDPLGGPAAPIVSVSYGR